MFIGLTGVAEFSILFHYNMSLEYIIIHKYLQNSDSPVEGNETVCRLGTEIIPMFKVIFLLFFIF